MKARLFQHSWVIGVAWSAFAIGGALNQLANYPYDYPVYWAWANGIEVDPAIACPYPERAVVFFSWLRGATLESGWVKLYAALIIAAGVLSWRLFNGPAWRRWPILSLAVLALAFSGPGGGIAGSLRCANVDLVLAALALSPPGAVLACCVKPQLLPLVFLHAAVLASRRGGV